MLPGMDFGKVTDPNNVDFRFPPDHADTTRLLAADGAEPAETPSQVYVGCAKWGRPDWIGQFYPKGTKAAQFLSVYAQHFNCVELNATFHRMPEATQTQKWADQTGAEFRFFPKMYQGVTHWQRLNEGAQATTEQFLRGMDGFGRKLGTIFVQLPPNFAPKSADTLRSYLRAFPRAEYRVTVELRHPGWFGDPSVYDETFAMLHELGVGAVITDTSGRRDVLHQRLTTNEAFIRFVGNNLHESDYTRLQAWADRIDQWLKQGLRRVCFFMHHPDEQHSPTLVTHFAKLLAERTGVAIRIPALIQEAPSLF